jgi:membrane associated rhomboid family serine protease
MSRIVDDIKLQYKIGGVANRLIYWNVGVFLLSIPLFYSFRYGVFEYPNWISISHNPSVVLFRPWTVLSYAFLHASFWHLFFNMLMLNFSCRLFLTYFTQKQLLGLYLLSAIFAGIVFCLSYFIIGLTGNLVGASAAILAVLVATTSYNPLMEIKLFLLGYVKLWHITGVILLLYLLQIGFANTGGHIAHFAGAFFGYIYIVLLKRGSDLTSGVNSFIDFIVNLFNKKDGTNFRKVYVNPKKQAEKRESRIVTKDKTQQQIDEILDKISKSGYDSLTKEEKEFLFNAGK